MKTKGKHPERKEMLRAIKTGKVPFRSHMDECKECRDLYTALSSFPVSGKPSMIQPSRDALASSMAVPALSRSRKPVRKVVGRLSFDSWTASPALDTREAPLGITRRICLEAGAVTLEIVAERTREGWDFVARAYRSGKVASEFALRVGRNSILPRAQGFYHWSSARAPRVINLRSPDLHVSFKGLTWR